MKILSGFLVLTLFVLGCQQKPTLGVTETGVLVQSPDYRKMITAKTVVFDTRSPFEFNTNKIPGSINLPVSDFNASKDLFDAARRLSFYGVDPETPILIVGTGQGDEQKLAWQFIQTGVTKIDTLKAQVFRLMNPREESPKKNVPLWKPESKFGELDQKAFRKKMESIRPTPTSRAKATVFQGFPVATALQKRILVVTLTPEWKKKDEYFYADHFYFPTQNLFDDKGLFNRGLKIDVDLKKYDVVFLADSGSQRETYAYALVQLGTKSLYVVPQN